MDDFLNERNRAEDIILGSLGIGEEATIISIIQTPKGFSGLACWKDGEKFPFESEEPLDDLEIWALEVLRRV